MRLITMVCRARNNLFHGGKFPNGPISDPVRNPRLLRHSLTILEACIPLDRKVRRLWAGRRVAFYSAILVRMFSGSYFDQSVVFLYLVLAMVESTDAAAVISPTIVHWKRIAFLSSYMSQISVIIVSWNARGYLRDCLNSVRHTGASVLKEIIVVDNASTDSSPEMVAKEFPEVKLIQSNENLGFARANNLGMRYASGSMLAFVNSDVIVRPGCLQNLAAFLESRPEVGLAGPKVFGA